MRMGLREANQHFSRAVKAVKSGRDVVLIERRRPVAIIEPLRERDAADAAIQRLVGEGRIQLAEVPGPIRRRRWRLLRVKGPPLSHILREDRGCPVIGSPGRTSTPACS